MPRIATIRSKDELNNDVIVLALSQGAVSLSPNGDPLCGITLSSEQARSLAQRLNNFALEIENQEEPGYRTSPSSLVHFTSVAVVHDGSQQGHRAFQAAFQIATRSLAALELVGIFGIKPGTGELLTNDDDYAWLKGWLSRVAE